MASIWHLILFFPQGTQLDNDEFADLQVNIGDNLGLVSILDTSGLDADLQSITLRLEADSTEVDLSDTPTEFFETTFPNVTVVVEDNSDEDFASLVVERGGEPGAIPNTANVVVESEATVLDGLVNDGAPDLKLTVLEATDVNGSDVTDLFEPSQQTIDLQPSPQVQEISGTEENEPIGNEDGDLSQEPFSNLDSIWRQSIGYG